MTVSAQDIQDAAKLARLRVEADELAELTHRIDDILGMVEQMQAVDTSGVEPMANPWDAVQRLRPDEVSETNQRAAFQKIAPATEDGLYLVPKVID